MPKRNYYKIIIGALLGVAIPIGITIPLAISIPLLLIGWGII